MVSAWRAAVAEPSSAILRSSGSLRSFVAAFAASFPCSSALFNAWRPWMYHCS